MAGTGRGRKPSPPSREPDCPSVIQNMALGQSADMGSLSLAPDAYRAVRPAESLMSRRRKPMKRVNVIFVLQSLLLVTFLSVPASASYFDDKLTDLKVRFPDGLYYDHQVPEEGYDAYELRDESWQDSVTETPCSHSAASVYYHDCNFLTADHSAGHLPPSCFMRYSARSSQNANQDTTKKISFRVIIYGMGQQKTVTQRL